MRRGGGSRRAPFAGGQTHFLCFLASSSYRVTQLCMEVEVMVAKNSVAERVVPPAAICGPSEEEEGWHTSASPPTGGPRELT